MFLSCPLLRAASKLPVGTVRVSKQPSDVLNEARGGNPTEADSRRAREGRGSAILRDPRFNSSTAEKSISTAVTHTVVYSRNINTPRRNAISNHPLHVHLFFHAQNCLRDRVAWLQKKAWHSQKQQITITLQQKTQKANKKCTKQVIITLQNKAHKSNQKHPTGSSP